MQLILYSIDEEERESTQKPVSMVEGYSYKLPPTQQPEQKTVVLFRNSLKL
jgi:hypothetical protein